MGTTVFAGQMVSMKLFYDGKSHNYKAEEIKIEVNGTQLKDLELPPVSIEDRTMVPARPVFEALGAELMWNQDTQEVFAARNNDIIVLKIGSKEGTKNGVAFTMDTAPKIINDKTTVPARAVSEALGCRVGWDESTRVVTIDDTAVEPEIPPVEIPPVEPEIPSIETPAEPEIPPTETPIEPQTPAVPPVAAENEVNVTGISIPQTTNDPQVFSILSSGAVEKYEVLDVSENRMVIDIYNANMAITNTSIPVQSSIVSMVRSAQNQVEPVKITRIVFDLRATISYNVVQTADKKNIIVSFSENTIKDIRFRTQNGIDFVDIEGTAAPYTKISTMSNPDRVIIDMPYAITELEGKLDVKGTTVISNAEIMALTDLSVRLVLEVPTRMSSTAVQNGTITTLQLSKSSINSEIDYNIEQKTLTLGKSGSFNINTIIHNDNYLNGEYTLTLPGNFQSSYGFGTIPVNDDYLKDITLKSDGNGNTVIQFNQKQIMAYTVSEDANYCYIKMVTPKEKYNKIVVLDAGHGGNDPGTSGNGLVEKDLNLDVALKVYQLFQNHDSIKVYITRMDNSYPENADRAAMANKIADLFVSIHMNSGDTNTAKNPIPNGTEVLYKVHSNDTGDKLTSKQAAETILPYILNALGTNNRGLKLRDDLLVLNATKVPAIIVETVFLSNPGNALLISQESNKDAAAQAIYNGIVDMMTNYRVR